jgi:hypothetical protein
MYICIYIYLVSLVFDQFLEPICNKEETLFINITKITRSQPPICYYGCTSCFGITNITCSKTSLKLRTDPIYKHMEIYTTYKKS